MNQIQAFRDTILLAEQNGMPEGIGSPFGLAHVRDMYQQACDGNFSEAKLGRWLGWAQCAVAAAGVCDLYTMKIINKMWS
ncbi:hypothetical protein BJD55_gp099 [Gordonia phage Yvonnetastic]|uniref:Uncharacterized protein n=1 Tax=Gordonia phage Yvonnetastic TaxID=1821566 RepID=A0A142K984_9CAUD|nr:hypothetical protein BJD55_gp099 [Gordonia phage Yvonnetastic]AMS02667.1 hypothetical protein SEA_YVONNETASTIC_123 [Gordonia phage Yvonnetastic]